MTEPMIVRIELRLKVLGMSAEHASLAAGMQRDAIRNLRRKKSVGLRGQNLVRLARVLKCTPEYLLGYDPTESLATAPDQPPDVEISSPPGYLPIPTIIIPAGMGGGRLIESQILGPPQYFAADLIRMDFRAQPKDLRLVIVEGESMEPVLRNRDRVIADVRKKSIIEPGLFVLWDGDGLVCKWAQRAHGSEPAKIKITSENKKFDPYEVLASESTIIGRVIWFARQL